MIAVRGAVVLIALALLPVLAWGPPTKIPAPSPDVPQYVNGASEIAAGHGYRITIDDPPRRPRYPPGVSLFLAPFVKVAGDDGAYLGAKAFSVLYVLSVAAAGWALGGPLAAALAAWAVGLSPFTLTFAYIPMSDAIGAALPLAALALARRISVARVIVVGWVLGVGALVRLSDLALIAPVLAAVPRRLWPWAAVGLAPPLLLLGTYLGSPQRTRNSTAPPLWARENIWRLPTPGDTSNPGLLTDGPWVVADRFGGALMQWLCPCGLGGPEASLPNFLAYPAGILGLYWVFTPPVLPALGLWWLWYRRHDPVVRGGALMVLALLALHLPYAFQAHRFLAVPLGLLTAAAAAAVVHLGGAGTIRAVALIARHRLAHAASGPGPGEAHAGRAKVALEISRGG